MLGTLLLMEMNSVLESQLMVASFLVLKPCVKEILVALYFVTSMDISHLLVFCHVKRHLKIIVACKDILECSLTSSTFQNGFEKVFIFSIAATEFLNSNFRYNDGF